MAGDWIKMRTDLPTHPKVVRISSALKADRFRTIGGLHSVWCLFDAHTVDGILHGYTLDSIDDSIGWAGFAKQMQSVGWLEESTEGVTMPRFEEHNGKSAKKRIQDTERKRVRRDGGQMSANQADKNGTREEKRREENKDSKIEECNEPPKAASLPPAPLQPASPTVMVFPCSGKGAKEWALTKQQIDDWAVSFPAVDVTAECRAAWTWIDANPTRKKTATGMKSFLVRWMGKAQNNGPAKTAPQQFKSSAEREREYSAKMAQNIFDRIPPEKLAEIAREEAEEKARQEARKLPTYRQTAQALSAAKPRKDPPPGFQYPSNWDTMQNYEQDMWLIDNGFSPVQRVKEYA